MSCKFYHLLRENRLRKKFALKLKKDRLMRLQTLFFGFERIEIRRHTNFCILTGAGKACYRHVRLSRHMFKRFSANGDIIGVRRSSY